MEYKLNENIYSRNLDESEKFVANKRENIKSDLITITHDKLENILLKHLEKLSFKNKWLAPLSLFLSLLATLLTAKFDNIFGLSKDIWQAIFIVCCCSSFIWLMISIFKLIIYRKEATLESLLNKIKAI